jgi:hypothetical protein
MIREFSFKYEELGVTISEVEDFMGYEPGASLEFFGATYQKAIKKAPGLCEIKGGYRIFNEIELDRATKTLTIKDTIFHTKNIIFSQIREATGAVLFMCTAGPGISNLSKKLMKGDDLLLGYIYDVIGSIVVEKAIDKMQESLKDELLEQGIHITHRFSPGYCDWDVSEQHKLFSFFPENFCGIRLSRSSLMSPIKSVSGIIGTGPNVKMRQHPCFHCNYANCFKNRSKVAV